MSGWSQHQGRAAVLARENVDTDQLIPARFMSAPRSAGYGGFLLHDLRDQPDFPDLNGASILIARRNFGGGSSREAAVYALVDAGFRAIIAPSFGDIFASNAVNNGLLPARVSPHDAEALIAANPAELSIDLENQTLTYGAQSTRFDLDPVWKTKLINGWDDIDLTASYRAQIDGFAQARRASAPWVWPRQQYKAGDPAHQHGSDT